MLFKRTTNAAAGLAILAQLRAVAGHGFPTGVSGPNGQYFEGFHESTWTNKASGSAMFIPDYEEPWYDVNAPEIACGKNIKAAEAALDIEAHQSLSISWTTHDNTAWVHDKGTRRAFLGPTGDRCQGTNVNDVQFTELTSDYTGFQTYNGNEWPAGILQRGEPWTVQIPDVSPGYYVLRQELTALHFSECPVGTEQDGHGCGTEFYPVCVCIHVTKGGGSYDMSQANKFPGGYYPNEPGHLNTGVYTNPGGISLAKFNTNSRSDGYTVSSNTGSNNNDNSGTNGDNNNGNTSSSTTSPAPSTATPGTPHCKKRKSKRGLLDHHKRMIKRGF